MTEEPKWLTRQRKLFTNFCNAKLADRDDVPPMTDILEDIKDGHVLYALLEELSGQSLAPLGRIKKRKPLSHIDKVANLSISFRYIHQTTKIVGIGPGDIADGHPSLVLGLLWSLIVFFTAKDLGGVDDVSALKRKILKWCQKRTERSDVQVRNLRDSFMGGHAFLAILNDIDPAFAYEPCEEARTNYALAFKEAADKYGVPELLDANDEDLWKDEQSMITYLSELMKRVPADGLTFDASALLRWVDESQMEDHIHRLCRLREPADCAKALVDIAQAMHAIDVIDHDADTNIVWLTSASKQPGLPTVLLVADYGHDEPTSSLGQPFEPITRADGRLQACAASGKAGCVGVITACAALTNNASSNKDHVNVDIALTPSYDVLEQFLKTKYDNDAPDYALVDTPNCASHLAPDKLGVVFACRGVTSLDVSLSCCDQQDAKLDDNSALLDANLGLVQVLAALRKTGTLLPNVPGLVGFKQPNRFTRAIAGVAHIDHEQLAANVGYTAPPRRFALLPRDQWTCVEHLCFHPGLAVTAIATSSSSSSSSATLTAYLAPGFDPKVASDALVSALEQAAVPWGMAPKITTTEGVRGTITDLAEPFLAKFKAAADAHHRRGCAIAASPAYLPVLATVQKSLPTCAAYAVGVADPAATSDDIENVLLNDVHDNTKTLVKLLATMRGIPKHRRPIQDELYE